MELSCTFLTQNLLSLTFSIAPLEFDVTLLMTDFVVFLAESD